ncbi:Smr/MutS family protein [Paracoccus spongiarum]|uniref:Smr/MutS family protein n=1 Tax=Paracoccus spongiarum TaxID=3064387 RepID=A0ABT9JAY2_9RHOB|nr:Smr/MutS family protein [Paracoccus sp. 2205BS29-5]MDP5306973.1 Smr/MutS family protein [Paracoccus sp. 2205BS29-5]
MGRRRRGLTPEEQDLWSHVARSATPLVAPAAPHRPPQADPAPGPRPAADAAPPAAWPRFRVGETAPAPGPLVSRAPGPAERLATAPRRMDSKLHRRMTQGKLRPQARLDLHGMTLAEAHPELIRFVLSCHARGDRLVLVITGKGRGDHGPLPTRPGALRHQVPHWLHAAPLAAAVQQVAPAHFRHGGDGAYYIYLRRPAGQ